MSNIEWLNLLPVQVLAECYTDSETSLVINDGKIVDVEEN